jgi:hypothetical protein
MTISWLNKLRNLNPKRSQAKGAAPHKPCLLLSLLDMAQDGELQEPELCERAGMSERQISDRTKAVFLYFNLPFGVDPQE